MLSKLAPNREDSSDDEVVELTNRSLTFWNTSLGKTGVSGRANNSPRPRVLPPDVESTVAKPVNYKLVHEVSPSGNQLTKGPANQVPRGRVYVPGASAVSKLANRLLKRAVLSPPSDEVADWGKNTLHKVSLEWLKEPFGRAIRPPLRAPTPDAFKTADELREYLFGSEMLGVGAPCATRLGKPPSRNLALPLANPYVRDANPVTYPGIVIPFGDNRAPRSETSFRSAMSLVAKQSNPKWDSLPPMDELERIMLGSESTSQEDESATRSNSTPDIPLSEEEKEKAESRKRRIESIAEDLKRGVLERDTLSFATDTLRLELMETSLTDSLPRKATSKLGASPTAGDARRDGLEGAQARSILTHAEKSHAEGLLRCHSLVSEIDQGLNQHLENFIAFLHAETFFLSKHLSTPKINVLRRAVNDLVNTVKQVRFTQHGPRLPIGKAVPCPRPPALASSKDPRLSANRVRSKSEETYAVNKRQGSIQKAKTNGVDGNLPLKLRQAVSIDLTTKKFSLLKDREVHQHQNVKHD